MANRSKPNRRLTRDELDERANERQKQSTRRWQQIAFILISAIVLLSMIVTLFVRY